MRIKILALGLVCLVFILSCKKGIENPYSPELPEESVHVDIKSFTFKVSVDFTDISIPFTNPNYPYWALDIRIYLNDASTSDSIGTTHIQGDGQIDTEWTIIPEGTYQLFSNVTHEIGARYFSSVGMIGNVPPEWQEAIRWRFQIVDIELDSSEWIVEIETDDTGWFDGWKAWVGTTEGSEARTLLAFRIENN